MTREQWLKVEHLYQAVLKLAPARRSAFLAEATGSDTGLRREVESLLAKDAVQEGTPTQTTSAPAPRLPSDVPEAAPGAQFGPYRLEASIGKGGMGEVWKARDTRLKRDIAIKFSAVRFSDRFERETRAIAALNHPNICTLYDVGPNYLVMEYIDGTPIAPVDTSRRLLDFAVQISDGLAAAHAAKVVHRDLKPDNILVTREGRIKILDFGLAQTERTEVGPEDATGSMIVTEPGAAVGTFAYMSPEQARGNPNLTAQSDQFSLGLILYELEAGKRAFQRGSAVETMAAIIREEPEPLPASVPTPLRWIIERLLSKEPTDRYDSTRDLHRELRQIRDRPLESATLEPVPAQTPLAPARKGGTSRLLAAGLAVAVVAGTVSWLLHPDASMGRQVYTPMEVSLENPSRAVWSPDGTAFSYSAGTAGERRVMIRYLNSPTPAPLTQGSSYWTPIGWSPDSKRVIALGKNPQGNQPASALFSAPVFGGEPDLIMPLDAEAATVSADGRVLATVGSDESGRLAVYTASPVGSPLKRYDPAPFAAGDYFSDPEIQFSPGGQSLALLFDAQGAKPAWRLPYPAGRESPRRMLKDLPHYGGTPQLSWFPGDRTSVISFADQQGKPLHLWIAGLQSRTLRQLTTGTSAETSPAVSPDGKKILFVQVRRDYMIVSASLNDATVERVISSEKPTGMPSWATHQPKMVYESARGGSSAIWMRVEGWDRPIVTLATFPPGTTNLFTTPSLSPGADRVIYARADSHALIMNWISSISGGPPGRLTNSQGIVEYGGSWSPDGSRFTYLQNRNGVASVMVARTSGEATPAVVRENVGFALPEWSPDGRWILFLDRPGSAGWTLISPDGRTVRVFGLPEAVAMTFSADSTHLYGIRSAQNRHSLFSLDLANKQTKGIGDIGPDFIPRSYFTPGVRLSLSPDGKRITWPAYRASNSLWMLEGFDPPTWMEQLREILPW
jgi:serine/threonine protein kinase